MQALENATKEINYVGSPWPSAIKEGKRQEINRMKENGQFLGQEHTELSKSGRGERKLVRYVEEGKGRARNNGDDTQKLRAHGWVNSQVIG